MLSTRMSTIVIKHINTSFNMFSAQFVHENEKEGELSAGTM